MLPERNPQESRPPERNGETRLSGPQSAKPKLAGGNLVDFSDAGMMWRGPNYPLLTPGKYQVRGVKVQGPQWLRNFHRWSLRIEFALTTEPGNVSAFYNLGNDPKGKSIGRQSRYFKAWVLANGGYPQKGQMMSPDVFLEGQFFEVEVENCENDSEGKPKPEAEVYSRVVKIVSVSWP